MNWNTCSTMSCCRHQGTQNLSGIAITAEQAFRQVKLGLSPQRYPWTDQNLSWSYNTRYFGVAAFVARFVACQLEQDKRAHMNFHGPGNFHGWSPTILNLSPSVLNFRSMIYLIPSVPSHCSGDIHTPPTRNQNVALPSQLQLFSTQRLTPVLRGLWCRWQLQQHCLCASASWWCCWRIRACTVLASTRPRSCWSAWLFHCPQTQTEACVWMPSSSFRKEAKSEGRRCLEEGCPRLPGVFPEIFELWFSPGNEGKDGKNLSSQTWSGSPRRPSPRHPRPPDENEALLLFLQVCETILEIFAAVSGLNVWHSRTRSDWQWGFDYKSFLFFTGKLGARQRGRTTKHASNSCRVKNWSKFCLF